MSRETLGDQMRDLLRPQMVKRAIEHEKEFPYELKEADTQ